MQLAHLQSASASLGLVEAVDIRHSLVKVRLPVLGALPSTGRVLISRPCGPLRTCLRAGGTVSHRNHLPVRVYYHKRDQKSTLFVQIFQIFFSWAIADPKCRACGPRTLGQIKNVLQFLRASPAGLGRPDSPALGSDHPHPCGALLPAIPRWRRPGAWFTDLPSHRALLGWSPGSHRYQPPSMVLFYHRWG